MQRGALAPLLGGFMFCLIDGNAIGYAAQSATTLTVDGMETQAIYNSLKTLKHLKTTFRQYPQTLWLWDGKADFRYDLYPDYKGNRADTAEKREMKAKYSAQKPYLEEMLTCLGITQVVSARFEADDLAGYFVRKAEARRQNTQLITGDGDWMQLISPTTCWHDPRRNPGKFCDQDTFEEITGYADTEQFLQAKALHGDTSDNIGGVGGLGEKAAAAIMSNYGSVKSLLEAYKREGEFTKDNLPAELSRYRKKLNDFCSNNIGIFTRNYRLMNLRSPERDSLIKDTLQITRGNKDMTRFEQLCKEFRFLSILRELNTWEALF